jgi:predicted component of viral defense system (DUF524 family)
MADPSELRGVLELRDAALIYEYWCFFAVVDAAADWCGPPTKLDRFATTSVGTHVPNRYSAKWDSVEVTYNQTYSRPPNTPYERGRDSYSVRLRPDISVRAGPKLHLFDAKFKLGLDQAVTSEDAEPVTLPPDTFKREDLYKMHAYRDALGADSVWILYPGQAVEPRRYPAPWGQGPGTADGDPYQGVGAVALRPGAPHDGGLETLVAELLAASVSA